MPPKSNQVGSKKNTVVIICLLILAVLVTWQTLSRALYRISNDFYHPYLNLPVQSEKYLSEKSLLIQSKNRLAGTIVQLRNENNRLRAEKAIYHNLNEENRELRKLMHLSETIRGTIIFADIIIRDPLRWNDCFTINKGENEGVAVGSLILAVDENRNKVAVVGRVIKTTRHNATVLTIINPDNQLSRLSVTLPESKVIGILEGAVRRNGKMLAKVIWLPKDDSYHIGEAVMTSGVSNYTVPAIYVGRIADYDGTGKAVMMINRLYKEAYVEPAVDIESLKTVMVVIKK